MTNIWISLGEIATARSGDKGNHANIGVIAKSEQAYQYLLGVLTADTVQNYFRQLGVTRTERYELPRVWAMNFMLYDALAGGASQSLRIDTQGKLLGTEILRLQLPVDEATMDQLRGDA